MKDTVATETNSAPVSFHLRLAPQKDAHDEMLQTRSDLVLSFGKQYQSDGIAGFQLYPVERAGKSGSEVFYLDVSVEDVSFPARFVAKFQTKEKTEKEAKAAQRAVHARLCSGIYSAIHDAHDLGIVVYKLAAARNHIEFRGFFLDKENSDEDCVVALRSALEAVGRDHNAAEPRKKMVDDYSRYVERPSRPLLKLKALTNAGIDDQGLASLAESVIFGYERICDRYNVDVDGYLVHGDLHARNLMINKDNPSKTELIDFDWVHFGHPAKDFVLMESTLKYMLLAELVSKSVRQAEESSESPHISARCIREFERFLLDGGLELPPSGEMMRVVLTADLPPIQRAAIIRAYLCIAQIRTSAKLVLDDYCSLRLDGLSSYDHYLVSSYLVTFGLLAIQDVNQIPAMIGLSIISEHLDAKDS